MADALEGEGKPYEGDEPCHAETGPASADQCDQVDRGEEQDHPAVDRGERERRMLDDDARQRRRAEQVDPKPRKFGAEGVCQNGERACGGGKPGEDESRGVGAAGNALGGPTGDDEPDGCQAAESAAVGVGPEDEDEWQGEQAARVRAAGFVVGQDGERRAHERDSDEVRANEKVETAGGDGERNEDGGGWGRRAPGDQAVGGECVGGGEERDGGQEQTVKSADSVDDRHRGFAEPLVGEPGPAGVAEAEDIGADDIVRVEHLAADDGVPEGAGVAEKAFPAYPEQRGPDYQKYEGLGRKE